MYKTSPTLLKTAVQLRDKSQRWYQDPVSQSIGRVGNIPQALALGTSRGVLNTSSGDKMRPLIEQYEKEKEQHLKETSSDKKKEDVKKRLIRYIAGTGPERQGELTVSTGGTSPLHNLKKVWTRPGLSLPGRIAGTAGSPLSDLIGSMLRADQYNPSAHTVSSFTDEPAVKAHELGHAADFQDKNSPLLYTLLSSGVPGLNLKKLPLPARLYQEGTASTRAAGLMNKLRNELKKKDPENAELYADQRLQRILSGGFGSYAGSALPIPGGQFAGAWAGQRAGSSSKLWRGRDL